ncbi:type III secretion protein C [Erwinia toletana]|uniref:Type 3 secretion system secretin n=1 Tax=Winslowiella toletana TaxID=92490 RepID=A0ABS4PAA4_9GAMM|nr:type III secretion system outer membrane ring subunit SctC [Winslowiella toletana]MBP2169581.1 type III secretion protein C [Winslowiella toletana]
MFKFQLVPAVCRIVAAITLLAFSISSASARAPEEWKNGAYAYSADNTPLSIILEDFANSFGVEINLGTLGDSNITGKLRADSPEAFLNRLSLEYRFQWFVYNNTLYISPQSAQSSQRLEISPDAAPDIKEALRGVGLLEPRFGWGELPDEGVVLVTGPPEYVRLIADFARKSEEKPDASNKDMMSFPLKYASVADRNIKYRDQQLLVPGVATMLNELLGQSNSATASGQSGSQDGGDSGMDQMQQQSQNILNQMVQRGTSRLGREKTKSLSSLQGTVSADVRNNALLVRDDPKNRAAYQALIDIIDVPQKLIEIDAVIIDVDRSELQRISSSLGGQFGNVSGATNLLAGSSTLFISDFSRFFASIEAMEGEGTASIIANPSILTLENQPAVIDFSDTAYIRAIGERVADIQAVTAGTSLRVTPRAISGHQKSSIQLIVDVEDGKLDKNDDGEAEGTNNGVISTQALVEAKRSLVMGGFHTKQSGDRERRIPILGSIPIIGKLFSSTRHETSQRERLFIITPHLIGDQVDPSRYIAAESREQLNNAMDEVSRRHKYTDMKEMVENAMRDLAQNRIPTGMTSGGSGLTLSSLCNIPSAFHSDFRRHQWYGNKSVQISVGVITNTSNQTQRFDEAACRSDRTLAVASWPRSALKPGDSAEVYVAFEPNGTVRPSRMSLLSAAGGAPAAVSTPATRDSSRMLTR